MPFGGVGAAVVVGAAEWVVGRVTGVRVGAAGAGAAYGGAAYVGAAVVGAARAIALRPVYVSGVVNTLRALRAHMTVSNVARGSSFHFVQSTKSIWNISAHERVWDRCVSAR